MSVKVTELSKIYQSQHAVDSLNFEANKGEILGFLGPNGAGKTTTMKMLCGYVTPSAGEAWVEGYNILKNPIEVKRAVGYLAENNPLYNSMYVREFLEYSAGLFKLPNIKNRVAEVIDQVGITAESHKLIGNLSKGYKQRVGLAQAIIHDPGVLILDEPTSGLDVNQLVEIRALIKSLSKNKTVIFSSHIMQEIEALCDRVIVINHGKLVANESISTLSGKIKGNQTITLELIQKNIKPEIFSSLKGVQAVIVEGEYVKITTREGIDVRKEIFEKAVEKNLVILEMRKDQMQFEEIFKTLTNS